MTLYETYIVYPEGETQEISHTLSINALVDVNGVPLKPPLPTNRMIAYRVFKKHTTEQRGIVLTRYFLELVSAAELAEYT